MGNYFVKCGFAALLLALSAPASVLAQDADDGGGSKRPPRKRRWSLPRRLSRGRN